MKRVFFEKDPHRDYLFVIAEHNDSSEVYRVNNFTDETGREYVYTLVGKFNEMKEGVLEQHISSLSNGKFTNFNGENELDSPQDCLESMIDFNCLNKRNDIYVYVRNK